MYNFKLIRSKRKTVSVTVLPDLTIVVRAPMRMKDADVEKFLQKEQKWIDNAVKKMSQSKETAQSTGCLNSDDIQKLKEKAYEYLPKRLDYFAELFGTDYKKLTVRCQHTRWGSCTSKGNISLNCLLMLLPADVCDSVIAHEICHRKHMDHSKSFYDELVSVFPEYRRCENWLKDNGSAILMRADVK